MSPSAQSRSSSLLKTSISHELSLGTLPPGYEVFGAEPLSRTFEDALRASLTIERSPSLPRDAQPTREMQRRPPSAFAPIARGHIEELPLLYATDEKLDPNPIAPPPLPRRYGGQGGQRTLGPNKQAKIFGEAELRQVEMRIKFTDRAPESALVMLLLSYFAGLRPCEIANLRTRTLFDGSGELLDYIEILPGTTKRGTRRVIPMHPRLREALLELLRVFPNAEHIAYRRDINGFIHYRSAAAVCQWFCKIYLEAKLHGCTGMSGRRSFATHVWEAAKETGASISDVKDLLGHVSLSTTQYYIERKNNSREIIDLL